jgi:hypothetical protein
MLQQDQFVPPHVRANVRIKRSREVNYVKFGIVQREELKELPAVEQRKLYIGNQQVYVSPMLCRNPDSFLRVGRLKNSMVGAESAADQPSSSRISRDYQDRRSHA